MASVTGTIIIVQEGRFQLTDTRGASHLFVLGPHAATETRQLRSLAERQTRVRVEYVDAGGLIARKAKRIELLADGPAPAGAA